MPGLQYRKEASQCRAAAAADPASADAARWRQLAQQFDLLAARFEPSEGKSAGMQRTRVRRQPVQQQQTKSGKREPNPLGQLRYYRPACSQCGRQTWLTRIEPAEEPGHDLRTFECEACGHSEVLKMKYR
jgi:DNA-directed RNA polymerase subunit RPC12/RpoP